MWSEVELVINWEKKITEYKISDLVVVISYISNFIAEVYQSIILLSDDSISLIKFNNKCFINVDIT